jgi:type VI secretion system secreted protein VgrG
MPKKHLQSGKYSHKEYNYDTPADPMYADLEAQTDDDPNPKWEVYDYPGDFDVHGEADEWVRWRIEEQEVDYDTSQGGSNCRSMIAGYQFNLTEHYRPDQNGPYLIRNVKHVAQEGTLIGGSDAQEAQYENTFSCQPADVQYRHPR